MYPHSSAAFNNDNNVQDQESVISDDDPRYFYILFLSGDFILFWCLANPDLILQRQQEKSWLYSFSLQPDLTSFVFYLRNKILEAIQSRCSVLIRLKAQASIEKSMKKKTAQDVFDKDEVQSDGDNMDDGFVLC